MSARITQFFWIISFPVSCLWALATHLRRKFYPYFLNKKINIKVVCVGNIHSGGSGKTPLVKAITDHLKDLSPVIVSRGYKGKLSSTGSRVERENKQGVECYGDESWMLANQTDAPVFIAQDRLSMIKKVELSYPKCLVVLDDGFQRLSVSKDISLICINTDKKIEDNFCLPLGELREPLSALRHADAVVLTPGANGGGADVWRTFLEKAFPNLKIFQVEHKVRGLFYEQMEKKIDPHDRIVSFCGIASPQRFTSSVQQLFPGSQHLQNFSDHHQYRDDDLQNIVELGNKKNGNIYVTTDKDWAKVAPFFKINQIPLFSLRTEYKLAQEFWSWLRVKIGEAKA